MTKLPGLNGLRAIAATLVLIGHVYQIAGDLGHKEAATIFPPALSGFATWKPAWLDTQSTASSQSVAPDLTPELLLVRRQLFAAPQTADALAAWLGIPPGEWDENVSTDEALPPVDTHLEPIRETLQAFPASTQALSAYLQTNEDDSA